MSSKSSRDTAYNNIIIRICDNNTVTIRQHVHIVIMKLPPYTTTPPPRSSASALGHRHLSVVLHLYNPVVISIDQRLCLQDGGYAADLGDIRQIHCVQTHLHSRVVRCVHVIRQGKRAVPVAVECVVDGRRFDPTAEPDFFEVHAHRVPPAAFPFPLLPRLCRSAHRSFTPPQHPFQRALIA